MSFGCKPTPAGAAKIAAAALGAPLVIAEMAFGDGNGNAVTLEPVPAALVREVHRVGLSSAVRSTTNPAQMIFRGILPPALGGITVREAGVFDDAGEMILYAATPAIIKYAQPGTGHDLIIELIAEISATANVIVQINPSVVLATLDDVDARIALARKRDRPFRYYCNGA